MSSFKYRDYKNGKFKLNFPADAPKGCPHTVDFGKMTQPNLGSIIDSSATYSLSAVDVIATILMMWKVEALADLLNLEKENFNWGHPNGQGYELYVCRYKNKVSVGSIELMETWPDFEVKYEIQENGVWKFTGGREIDFIGLFGPQMGRREFAVFAGPYGNQHCAEYDNMFATALLVQAAWENPAGSCKVYNVDGKDMLEEKSKQDVKDAGKDGERSKGGELAKEAEDEETLFVSADEE